MGLEDGLGVECLSGSGAIASAYSRAFREGWTVTLVSGRTVGIGAYLARLGRRCGLLEGAGAVVVGGLLSCGFVVLRCSGQCSEQAAARSHFLPAGTALDLALFAPWPLLKR